MNKKAFTLIELVFIIVIIGILASIALPKFNKMDDTAKINAEMGTMRAVISSFEVANAKYKDIVNSGWRGGKDGNKETYDVDEDGKEEKFANGVLLTLHSSEKEAKFDSKNSMDISKKYALFNDQGKIFSKLVKNSSALRVIAYVECSQNGIGENGEGDDSTDYDIIAVTAQASSRFSGAPESSVNKDIVGRPDENDFWIYNGSPYPIDLNTTDKIILSDNANYINPGELVLIDIDGSKMKSDIRLRNIKVQRSDHSGKSVPFRELTQDGFN